MLINIVSKIDKKIFNGFLKKSFFYYRKIQKRKAKKIKDINFTFQVNERKIILLSDLLKKSLKDGVIVECGVGNGFSLAVISNLSEKKIYAFDSFCGFPEKISKNDQSDKDTRNLLDVLKNEKSHYKLMTIDAVKKNLINNNISNKIMEDKIIFKKDFFQIVLNILMKKYRSYI